MKAHRREEFTGGSRVVATIDQMDSPYYKVGGDPFVAAGIVGSTCSPAAGTAVPTTIGSLAGAVGLVEGAARQGGE